MTELIFINSVFLYDNKLVIAFNWKDGAKIVSLAEIKSTVGDDESVKALRGKENESSYLEGILRRLSKPVKKAEIAFAAGFCYNKVGIQYASQKKLG